MHIFLVVDRIRVKEARCRFEMKTYLGQKILRPRRLAAVFRARIISLLFTHARVGVPTINAVPWKRKLLRGRQLWSSPGSERRRGTAPRNDDGEREEDQRRETARMRRMASSRRWGNG
jgi:hypothetical protein